MRLALLGLILGLISIRWFPYLPSSIFCALFFILGLILTRYKVYLVATFLMGVVWATITATWVINDRLDMNLDGAVTTFKGTVIDLPEVSEYVTRFYVKNNQSEKNMLPKKIRLSWYRAPVIKTGEEWLFKVKLKYPRGTVNPHTFDYEAWLTAKHIGATGVVKSGEIKAEASTTTQWRYNLRERITASTHYDSGGLIALILGDKSGISQEQWRILQATGTVHLMVISGQHIALLAGLVYFFVAFLARLGIWSRRLSWLKCACVLSFCSALIYGWLAGFGIPVVRACVMLFLVLLWRMSNRSHSTLNIFLITLAVVLLIDPLASLQSGFWLSFGAVGILLFIFSGRLSTPSWWHNITKAQWGVFIGLTPFLLVLLLPVSLVSPLANLLAIPVISFIVVPCALLGTLLLPIPYVGSSLLILASKVLSGVFVLLDYLTSIVPIWMPAALSWWGYASVILGVLILLLPRGVPIKMLGAIFCLPLFISTGQQIVTGEAKVVVFDVGQGLAVLVKTKHHALLYDAGPAYGDFDTGQRIIVPSLKKMGISQLNSFILSHADMDHAGGASSIYESLQVKRVISGEPDKLKTLSAQACQSGKKWSWDGVEFTLWQSHKAPSGNDASCVLRVKAKKETLLLTGDISARIEKEWIRANPQETIDWLLAPHHGSKNASSGLFLKKISVKNVIISRGWLNAFHHPHPSVLKRYNKYHSVVWDTAQQGAITIYLGQFLTADYERNQHHFWRKR